MANNSVSRDRSRRGYTVRMSALPWDFIVIGTPLSHASKTGSCYSTRPIA
jgi:hypothetical protein